MLAAAVAGMLGGNTAAIRAIAMMALNLFLGIYPWRPLLVLAAAAVAMLRGNTVAMRAIAMIVLNLFWGVIPRAPVARCSCLLLLLLEC